ncbi:hypothetical protein MRX96_034096 [Rhipicephalus microplus]
MMQPPIMQSPMMSPMVSPMMGPQTMGPMMGPQVMGSNSERVFCKLERYGGSRSDSDDDDYYEGGDGYRRRGRRRRRGKRWRSRRSSYSPSESSMPQNASLYSVPSAPAFLGPIQPQQQQVYQVQPMMGTPQRAAQTAGLAAAPQPPYITDISNDQRDLDAIREGDEEDVHRAVPKTQALPTLSTPAPPSSAAPNTSATASSTAAAKTTVKSLLA